MPYVKFDEIDGSYYVHESISFGDRTFIINRYDACYNKYYRLQNELIEEMDNDENVMFGLLISFITNNHTVMRSPKNKPLLCIYIDNKDIELRNNSLKALITMATKFIMEFVVSDKEKELMLGGIFQFMNKINDTMKLMNRCLTESNRLNATIREMRSKLLKDIEDYKYAVGM